MLTSSIAFLICLASLGQEDSPQNKHVPFLRKDRRWVDVCTADTWHLCRADFTAGCSPRPSLRQSKHPHSILKLVKKELEREHSLMQESRCHI